MDSLPQELIDKIIDHLPDSDTHSYSLIAKPWRQRSQKHYFASVVFSREEYVVRWCKNIPQDPDGIPSYVRSVQFLSIHSWREPVLFGRILKMFTSMTNLQITDTDIPQPDEVPGSVPFGEFGEKIKALTLWSTRCTIATIGSLVFSLPNLEDLFLAGKVPREPPTILPHASRRGPLASLQLYTTASGVGASLAQSGLESYKLYLFVSDLGLEQVLAASSKVVVVLELCGAWLPGIIKEQRRYSRVSDDESPMVPQANRFPPTPLPALTTIDIGFYSEPSNYLADILSSIHSAPALATVNFVCEEWYSGETFPSSGPWASVDKWLARMATQVAVKGNIVVTLERWPDGGSAWEEYFPEFRKAGGELRVTTIVGEGG